MSEVKEIIELFKLADQMIVDYLGMMDNFERHIRARVERGTPLPQGVIVALHHGVEDDVEWLTRALRDLGDDKRVVAGHLGQIRRSLASAKQLIDMLSAVNLLSSWPNNVERSMETVINTFYQSSDILPPPFYWKPVNSAYYKTFINSVENPSGSDRQLNVVVDYLNTVENPWSIYATQ